MCCIEFATAGAAFLNYGATVAPADTGAPPQYGAPQPPYYQPPQQQFPGGYGALPQGYGEPGRDYLGGFGGPPQYGPSPGQWGPPPQGMHPAAQHLAAGPLTQRMF